MKKWYMTNYKPNNCGGYENDALSEYAESNFTDVLKTSFSDEAILYSSDLKESKPIRCVIQGNTADTALKSLERTLLVPIGTVESGMYVFFENSYWLIDGRPGNNKSYEKATLKLCQYNLRWQTADGNIHERPVSITSSSKYDVGETGGSTIILSSNNYIVLVGYDDNALELDGMRVFIDKRKTKPERVFKFTRTDDVLFDFGEQGSYLSFIADKTEFNANADNQELRICDYHTPTTPSTPNTPPEDADETTDLRCTISGGTSIRIGRKKVWTAKFTDADGVEITDQEFTWNVVADFDVTQTVTDNKIQLVVNDEIAIGSLILLQVIVDGSVVGELSIEVQESY